MKQINNNIHLLNIIKHPIITDKTTKSIEEKIYYFAVEKKSNKESIKKAIEYIFNVKVKNINTLNLPKKVKNIGKFKGNITQYKKAIIKLQPQYTIKLFENT